ncbi:MAG: hypothetical protein KDA85_00520 [Planctomycetaceae bacterium]|nr:hypothetical protein [Planctomycetaceae bacterium]
MSDVSERCAVCGAMLDEEDLFCANCGTEAPNRDVLPMTHAAETSTCSFRCSSCAASMSYDASSRSLRCPFCGSEKLEELPDEKILTAKRIIPFVVTQQEVLEFMRKKLGSSFWMPGDLAATATVTRMLPVYVPFWAFSAQTLTYWTADTSRTPPGASADWFPLTGEHRSSWKGILVGASSALTQRETIDLCPFDLSTGRPREEVDTNNWIVEQFRLQRKHARPLARQGIEELEKQECTRYVPGRCRNMKVNVRLHGLSSEPILVPVWIMAYRYRDRVFRFLVNGQTGRTTGQMPLSRLRIVGVIVAVLIAILIIATGVGLLLSAGR